MAVMLGHLEEAPAKMYGLGKLRRPTMYQRQWFESGGLAIDKYRRAAGEGAHYLD
jgi:hypothetical protein